MHLHLLVNSLMK